MSSQRNSTLRNGAVLVPDASESQPTDGLDPVLVAARQVIMEHGPRRATLAEVARQAGVSRMTVYRRFESLDRLVSALLTVELGEVFASMPLNKPEQTATRQYAVDLVAGMTRAIADHPLIDRVLTVDPESMVPLMVQRFGQTQRASVDLLAPVLAEGMRSEGGDGSVRDDDPKVLAQTIITAAQAFIFGAQALRNHPLGEQVWNQWPAMVAGFLVPPGHAIPATADVPTANAPEGS